MASLVADNFRVFAAEQFMESLEEPLDAAGNALADSSTEALRDRSKIYVFIGRSQTWNSERYSDKVSMISIRSSLPPIRLTN